MVWMQWLNAPHAPDKLHLKKYTVHIILLTKHLEVKQFYYATPDRIRTYDLWCQKTIF